MKISAVIITKNEESNISHCLNSLSGVADEIIVVDALSDDATKEICESFPKVRFYTKVWTGYATSKNFGNDLAFGEYILSVDADEVLSETLRLELAEIKPNLTGNVAYALPRLNHIGTSEIKHCGWYPDKKLRLFPANKSLWTGDFVHEKLFFEGQIKPLKSDLLHFTYRSEAQYEEKIKNYALLSAQESFEKGKKMSLSFALLKAGFKFIQIYFFKLGFLDGKKGKMIAEKMAKYVLWKYIALKQLNGKSNSTLVVGTRWMDKMFTKQNFDRVYNN